MQAIVEQSPVSPKVIVFRTRMGAQAPLPPEHPQQPLPAPVHTWWQQHGTTATWVAIAVALLVGLANTGSSWYFRHVDSSAKSADEHINGLIDAKLNPAIKGIDDSLDKKLEPIIKRLDEVASKVDDAEGQLKRLRGDVDEQGQKQKQLLAVVRVQDPSRVLAMIRLGIQTAENTGRVLPASDLVDYRNAIQALPTTAYEYWTTAAAIINYQSLINQMSGEAPDPSKVSRPCGSLTNGEGNVSIGNVFVGMVISNCVVDLDAQAFEGITFKNSVVRYNGSPTDLVNVAFVNCRFILNLKAQAKPANTNLLVALLESQTQKTVSLR